MRHRKGAGGSDLRGPGIRNRGVVRRRKQEFLADIGMKEPGLNRLIRAAYQLLGLQTYFYGGVKEVRPGPFISATPRRRLPV